MQVYLVKNKDVYSSKIYSTISCVKTWSLEARVGQLKSVQVNEI